MLLHRAPLLTPTPTPFEQSYYSYTTRLRLALSNPPPLDFYYKKGSLTERRFMRSQWTREREAFGERLAGKKVDVGDIPAEEEVHLESRTEGDERAVGTEGRTEVERVGAGHVYLFVKDKRTGGWGLPVGGLEGKEALHEAAVRCVTDGLGKGMDTWLVTRKPIGVIENEGNNVRSLPVLLTDRD
jgi:large subunit ribosomal protein L46